MVKKTETKTEEKKTYDWKKGVKKVEKKEPVEAPKPEKVTLKKPKEIEKAKEPAPEGPKLKPIPAKEKAEEEEVKEGPKLKPIPQKPKPEEVCIIFSFCLWILKQLFCGLHICYHTKRIFLVKEKDSLFSCKRILRDIGDNLTYTLYMHDS